MNISVSTIEEYDEQLLEDISQLEGYVSKDVELSKDFMRAYGASEKTIEEVADKASSEGRSLSMIDGSGTAVLSLAKYLQEMVSVYKAFPFRILMGDSFMTGLGTKMCVITEDDWFLFYTCPLNDEERREYAEHWWTNFKLNYPSKEVYVYNWYPNSELMRFMTKILTKYGTKTVLIKDDYADRRMTAIWEDLRSKDKNTRKSN